MVNYLISGGGGGYNSAGGAPTSSSVSYGGSGGGGSYGTTTTNTGGNGGNGNIMTYAYSTPPVNVGSITITPTTTGNVDISIVGVKNGSTLGSEISTMTLTNNTTSKAFSIDVLDGLNFHARMGTETGLTIGTAYAYTGSIASDTTGMYITVLLDEVR
jgi:hypothetical protein